MKTLPIGNDNFKDIIESCYYIDKTETIHELLTLTKGSAVLFTRPRRFGKSLMLSMLKYFFEYGHDDVYHYFDNLKIAQYPDDIKDHMGKYEVISINMKDVTATNKEDLILRIKQTIINEFKRHKSILSVLNEDDKDTFNQFLNVEMNNTLFRSSLKELSRLIFNVSANRPILIMDEYDMPLQSAYEYGYYNDVYEFLKGLYSETIKSNEYLRLSILSGVTRAGKMSLFSGLNNLKADTILDRKFQNSFGFDEMECKELLKYYGYENEFENMKKWYGGYHFGNKEIYNPWSVLNALDNKCFYQDYWNSTTTTSLLRNLIERNYLNINEALLNLMEGKLIDVIVDTTINYADINVNDQSILSFLLFMGYLTVEDTFNSVCSVKIPNIEMLRIFKNELMNVLFRNQNYSLCREIGTAFNHDETVQISKLLEKYISSSFSYFDFNDEKNYQIMLVTLFTLIFNDYYIKSECNNGLGRSDIMAIPKEANKKAFIIEVKQIKYRTSKERLKDKADQALKQIYSQDYYNDLIKLDMKEICLYGIAFAKQNVEISFKKLEV